jgi:hypothetical protein
VSAKQNLSPPRSRRFSIFCQLLGFALLLPLPSRAESLEDAAHELAIKVCLALHKQPVKVAWRESPDSMDYWSDARKTIFLEQLSACGLEAAQNSEAAVLHVSGELTPSRLLLIAESYDPANGPTIHVVAIPRTSRLDPQSAVTSPRLNRELQWQQQEPIRSALEWQDSSLRERFLFLVSEGLLVRLQFEISAWKLIDSSPLPAARRHSRLGDGFLKFYFPGQPPRVFLDRTSCSFSPSGPISFACEPLNLVGQATRILSNCEGSPRYLGTGKGDYTQPDRITLGSLDMGLSAPAPQDKTLDSVEMPGPVLNLSLAEDLKTAFAAVRNLSTGSYEVYRITAVCGN